MSASLVGSEMCIRDRHTTETDRSAAVNATQNRQGALYTSSLAGNATGSAAQALQRRKCCNTGKAAGIAGSANPRLEGATSPQAGNGTL
eukprot:15191912-Alexandrium_andersonii.AAC.1